MTEAEQALRYFRGVQGYYLALARYDYAEAIRQAQTCLESPASDTDARVWADRIQCLELKMTRGLDRIWAALGMKKEVIE